MNYYLQIVVSNYLKSCFALTVSSTYIEHYVINEMDDTVAENLLDLAVLDVTLPDPTLEQVKVLTQVRLVVTSDNNLLNMIDSMDIKINDDLTVDRAHLTSLGVTIIT
jgi:hypothetical protein